MKKEPGETRRGRKGSVGAIMQSAAKQITGREEGAGI